jgi:RimJ/RimL family protein N-acetyltransferase
MGPLWRPDPPVVTRRLLLRPYQEGDLTGLHDIHARPEVVRYLPWAAHQTLEDSRLMLEARQAVGGLDADGDKLVLAVTDRLGGALLGEVALILVSRASLQGEVGFILHPDYHGQGYAHEAAEAMLRIGFVVAGLHRIIGRCDARNAASAGLLSRLGMRQEAHFREAELVKGVWVDRLIYACLATEFGRS